MFSLLYCSVSINVVLLFGIWLNQLPKLKIIFTQRAAATVALEVAATTTIITLHKNVAHFLFKNAPIITHTRLIWFDHFLFKTMILTHSSNWFAHFKIIFGEFYEKNKLDRVFDSPILRHVVLSNLSYLYVVN